MYFVDPFSFIEEVYSIKVGILFANVRVFNTGFWNLGDFDKEVLFFTR